MGTIVEWKKNTATDPISSHRCFCSEEERKRKALKTLLEGLPERIDVSSASPTTKQTS